MSDTATHVLPDPEEYAAIMGELNDAKTNLYRLRILKRYSDVEGSFGASAHPNLLSYLSRGKQITEKQLGYDLAAQQVRVDVLEELLQDYNDRQDAASSVPAPDPVEAN